MNPFEWITAQELADALQRVDMLHTFTGAGVAH